VCRLKGALSVWAKVTWSQVQTVERMEFWNFMHSKTELQLTPHNWQDSQLSYLNTINTINIWEMIESACHSLGMLLKECWGPLTFKRCYSLTYANAMNKWSLLSGDPLSYM
jgi:hypothetical protein